MFDKPLTPNPSSSLNWDVTEGILDHNVNLASAIGHQSRIFGVAGLGFTPPPGVSYHASPPDLVGLNGVPVAPFVKVPFV